MQKSSSHHLGIFFRGIAMGAADVVPGVSGGTIAFITGIYEELISSLSNLNLKAVLILKNNGLKTFWKHINGNFFLALFLGIAVSIFSLAKMVTYLLDTYPILLWSFFFGLVLSSGIMVVKTVKQWNVITVFNLVLGIALAAFVSSTQMVGSGDSLPYIFLSGAIAICAMILPGISGAFILVLLGSYATVMNGIKEFNITLIVVFMLGCVTGLLSFSKLLKYLFQHYKEAVLALLSGFLFGSLVKVWPWKENVGDEPIVVHSSGKEDFLQQNVLPTAIDNNHLLLAIVLFVVGFSLIYILSKRSPKSLNE